MEGWREGERQFSKGGSKLGSSSVLGGCCYQTSNSAAGRVDQSRVLTQDCDFWRHSRGHWKTWKWIDGYTECSLLIKQCSSVLQYQFFAPAMSCKDYHQLGKHCIYVLRHLINPNTSQQYQSFSHPISPQLASQTLFLNIELHARLVGGRKCQTNLLLWHGCQVKNWSHRGTWKYRLPFYL